MLASVSAHTLGARKHLEMLWGVRHPRLTVWGARWSGKEGEIQPVGRELREKLLGNFRRLLRVHLAECRSKVGKNKDLFKVEAH